MGCDKKEMKMEKVGNFINFKTDNIKNVVDRITDRPVNIQAINDFEMADIGRYSAMRMTPQGQYVFQPIPCLADYMAAGGLRRLGGVYYEKDGGYVIALGNGQFCDFTNFTGKIKLKEVNLAASGEKRENYVVELKLDDRKQYTIKIPSNEWCMLQEYIERYAPICQIFGDEINKPRERFKRIAGYWLKDEFPVKTVASFWGWGPLRHDKTRIFYHGGRDDCTAVKKLPTPNREQSEYVLASLGLHSILEAGDYEVTFPLLMYALASYTDALFTDAGFPLAHCLMLIGESGFLKTSLAKEIFSPFSAFDQRTFTVRSTEASMNVLHEKAFDDTLVVDDFNMEGSTAEVRQKMKNIRGLIRGYSDKTPRAKYGGDDNIKQYAMRGGCIFTAETQMTGQLKSGELRYFKVCLHKPMIKERVAYLHNNPLIVPQFYALYIHFLEANYASIVSYIKNEFPVNRAALDIPEPRMKDAYVHLKIVGDILINMMQYLSAEYSWGDVKTIKKLLPIIYGMAMRQSVDAQIGEPYVRYLEEVWNLIGTGKVKVAECLDVYAGNINLFMGYRENDLLIMKKDELYKAVIDAFYARNEGLPIGIDEVSRKLKESGLTKCDSGSCLVKASSKIPGRPRMLAFIISECNKKIGGKK